SAAMATAPAARKASRSATCEQRTNVRSAGFKPRAWHELGGVLDLRTDDEHARRSEIGFLERHPLERVAVDRRLPLRFQRTHRIEVQLDDSDGDVHRSQSRIDAPTDRPVTHEDAALRIDFDAISIRHELRSTAKQLACERIHRWIERD